MTRREEVERRLARALMLRNLIAAHNNALRQRTRAVLPGNIRCQYMGNVCLNFQPKRKTQEHLEMYRRWQIAQQRYNKAYRNLKQALGEAFVANTNNNNIYNLRDPPNYLIPSSQWAGLANVIGVPRAATTIQRYVRGRQQRNRTGVFNPGTTIGRKFLKQTIRRSGNNQGLSNNNNNAGPSQRTKPNNKKHRKNFPNENSYQRYLKKGKWSA